MQKEKQIALLFHMLEQEVNAKQKLEFKIKRMQSELEAMIHIQGDEDSESIQRDEDSESMMKFIEEHRKDIEALESLTQDLTTKEWIANEELQLARNELIIKEGNAWKLELEIKKLHNKLEAMKHIQGDEDSESMNKIIELQRVDLEAMESLIQDLTYKERIANDELQLARKALIYVSYLIG
jgi:heme oxygenase